MDEALASSTFSWFIRMLIRNPSIARAPSSIIVGLAIVATSTAIFASSPENLPASSIKKTTEESLNTQTFINGTNFQKSQSNLTLPKSPAAANTQHKTIQKTSISELNSISRLKATARSNLDSESWVIIGNKQEEERAYYIGDLIPGGAKITNIEIRSVDVSLNGQIFSISFTSTRQANDTGTNSPSTANSTDQDLTSREKLLNHLKLKPLHEGKDDGYLVTEDASKLRAKYGLQIGDVIKSANGYPLGSAPSDALAINALRNEKDITVTIIRNKEELSISYTKK